MKFLAIILLAATLGGCLSGGAYVGSGGHYGIGVGVGI
jgi:hypothetical protein